MRVSDGRAFATACRIALVSVLGLASIAHAASSLAAERGWLPVIALAGARDPARAITTLREVTRLWEVARHHTETDAATRDFLNRATSSFCSAS